MNYRRITELFGGAGAAAGAVAVGTEIAQAQDDLGASISSAVKSAVAPIDTDGSGTVDGGTSTESNSIALDESTGTAIADASGGDSNLAFAS
jgi:hypothetical protein